MTCPRCRQRMNETKGTHHKKKKYICPRCGKVRFKLMSKKRVMTRS